MMPPSNLHYNPRCDGLLHKYGQKHWGHENETHTYVHTYEKTPGLLLIKCRSRVIATLSTNMSTCRSKIDTKTPTTGGLHALGRAMLPIFFKPDSSVALLWAYVRAPLRGACFYNEDGLVGHRVP